MNVMKRYALKVRVLFFFMLLSLGLGVSGLYLVLVKTPQDRANERALLAVYYQKTLQQTSVTEHEKRKNIHAALKANALAHIAQYPFSLDAWEGFHDANLARDIRRMLNPALKDEL